MTGPLLINALYNLTVLIPVDTCILFPGSGGSRGGAWGARPPPLFLDQNEARRAEKKIGRAGAPPYLRVWMTTSPPPLSEGLDPPLPSTIETSLPC